MAFPGRPDDENRASFFQLGGRDDKDDESECFGVGLLGGSGSV